jgi:hypothetical protein
MLGTMLTRHTEPEPLKSWPRTLGRALVFIGFIVLFGVVLMIWSNS